MEFQDIRKLVHELLLKPFGGAATWVVGSASFLSWVAIGDNWTTVTKLLSSVAVLSGFLFVRAVSVAYSMYSEVGQLNTVIRDLKSDAPLQVRSVSEGKNYYEGQVTIILEQCHDLTVGDVLTLFEREGDKETPLCILSVEAITTAGFPQSVVFRTLTRRPLFGYLRNPNRLKRLHAKRGVSRYHLEGGPQND